MKKVLIITYYWPPTGGAGVQRWLKFSKYFREFGWEPVIYTPSNPDFPITDNTLLKDVPEGTTVLRTAITEPYDYYRKIMRKKKNETVNQGFLAEGKENQKLQSFMIWIRGNFFIPDARKFWIKPSIKYLTKYLSENKIDAVISTGPPHSMHMIALGLKQKLGIPWIADFRDPWTQIDFYDQLKLSSFADKKHHRLEKQVLTTANEVVTVSPTWALDLEELSGRKMKVITNGFDEEDFKATSDRQLMSGFLFHHIGALNKDRNPKTLWKVLGDLCAADSEFKQSLKLKFTGKTDAAVFDLLEKHGIADNSERTEYVQHSEVVKLMMNSPILLLPLNNTPNTKGVVPGKIFEYLAAGRPVFAIGMPDGDSGKILKSTNAGTIVDFSDYEGTKAAVLDLYSKYKSGKLTSASGQIDAYTRKNCAKQYAALLNGLVHK